MGGYNTVIYKKTKKELLMIRIGEQGKVIDMEATDAWDANPSEVWRDTVVEGYKVSNFGRVISWKRRLKLTLGIKNTEYTVWLLWRLYRTLRISRR